MYIRAAGTYSMFHPLQILNRLLIYGNHQQHVLQAQPHLTWMSVFEGILIPINVEISYAPYNI